MFAPFDEDFGYATLESFLACKPEIMAIDSGGLLESLEDDATGAVCEPTAAEIDFARGGHGEAGYERVRLVTGDGVIERLLAD